MSSASSASRSARTRTRSPRHVRALQPAGRRLLPRAGQAGRRRGDGPGRLPRRPRGPVRLLAASPAGPAQSLSRPPRTHRGGRVAPAHRGARGARAGRRLPEAAGGGRRTQDCRVQYYAISRDEDMERASTRTGLQLVAGEWYLIGWCHCARLSAPSGSRASARASSTTHAGHTTSRRRRTSTFAPTATSRVAAGRTPRHGAGARLAGHGVVGRGTLGPLRHGGAEDDGGSSTRRPTPTRGRSLAGCLGSPTRPNCSQPRTARAAARAADELAACSTPRRPSGRRSALRPRRPAAASPARRRPEVGGGPVHPAHRADQLPAAPLHQDDEALLDVAAVRADLGVSPRNCGRTCACSTSSTSAATGRSVRGVRGPPQAECLLRPAGPALARPARLSPLQADTLLLAIELVGHHLPTATGAALESAAAKVRRARGGAPALSGGDLLLAADASSGTSTAPSWSGACSPSTTGPRAPTA